MPTLSDTSMHEDDGDIIAGYENQDSGDDRGSLPRGNQSEAEEDNTEGQKTGRRIDPSTSKKHVVRNPIATLNTARLKGPKGIHTIESYFEGFKFHGHGHEKTDLDRVMKRIEHWAHRLFPKLDYDDFITKVETLGNKKDLQVFIKRYRLDMITPEEDGIVHDNVVEDEDDDKEKSVVHNEFDMLIDEQIERQKNVALQHKGAASASNDIFNKLLESTNKNFQPKEVNNASTGVSDEVKARIEKNRQLAIQRRLARLEAMQEEAKRKKLEETEGTKAMAENHPSSSNDSIDKSDAYVNNHSGSLQREDEVEKGQDLNAS